MCSIKSLKLSVYLRYLYVTYNILNKQLFPWTALKIWFYYADRICFDVYNELFCVI